MEKYFYRKSFVLIIIVLFIGLNILPNASGTNEMVNRNEKNPITRNFNNEDKFHYNNQKTHVHKTELIEQYTWSVLRYGLRSLMPSSTNFGSIYYARPSPGTSLIPAAMTSAIACHTALSIYHENKKDTLRALEKYDINTIIHTQTAFFYNISEWNSPAIQAYRRESTEEMEILGDISFLGDLVGNCYAQASFNTAVLRLCGFGPEEVFNIGIQDHTVNIVKVEGQWYAMDSTKALEVRLGQSDSIIYEFYDPSQMNMINFLENDKYFVNFGTKYPDHYQYQDPYLFNLFSNMGEDLLLGILEEIIPLFNNSVLGIPEIDPHEFIEKAVPCPEMSTISVPYTIRDAVGSTLQEKVASLINLTMTFILNQSGNHTLNQYDKSLYVRGLLSVDFPQVYANAAKYAAWTSYFGIKFDTLNQYLDIVKTTIWIRMYNRNFPILQEGSVAFPDLLYLRHAGSTIDQAIQGYGTLRNMKKDNTLLWKPEDLYVLVTQNYQGYLAINITKEWSYLNFGKGKIVSNTQPDNIIMAFNEIEYLSDWNK